MRYNYAIPALALAGSAFAAPAVVTQTNVVYVTATPSTASAEVSASHAPQVGAIYEVVVSKLVEVKQSTTETHVTTFTRTKSVEAASHTESAVESSAAPAETTTSSPAASTTSAIAQVEAAAEVATTSADEDTTVVVETTSSSVKPTTTLTPTTTSSTAASTSTSSTAAATSSSSTDSSFASTILDAHNAKRALHGVSDLTWSSTLEAYAQAYADEYDCSGTLTHSGGQYGENLGLGYTTTGVVDAWYNEIDEYSYSNPSASHFTQVVWKSTTQLGCAAVQCGSYWGQYTICSYNPAGNVAGEYSENVLALV